MALGVKNLPANAGDPGSIPELGRSPGERIGYPLQYSWASLVAQVVKNLPAMHETWVLIPGSGRSPGERINYPLQYSWASLVSQIVKNLSAMNDGFDPWVGKIPGGGHGNPLKYSYLENPHG